jgi:hypothetical protein
VVDREPSPDKGLDPNYLFTIEEKMDRVRDQANVYRQSGNSISSIDRFGSIILPRKPIIEPSGPGGYETLDPDKTRLQRSPNYMISPIPTNKSMLERVEVPGPGTYKPLVEYNNRISHHYWLGDPGS